MNLRSLSLLRLKCHLHTVNTSFTIVWETIETHYIRRKCIRQENKILNFIRVYAVLHNKK